ncbi:amino acid ABC transporter permease [Paracoccus sp. (in: a-proteobacteria)]|uniref:amino acid ABC transporter permease n=1 Tax=Paracoccus sp. TaxID=267 RepID=UPI0032201FDA
MLAETLAHWPQFLKGLMMTIGLSLPGFLFGLVIGLLLLAMLRARFAPLRWLASIYISFIRGTPLLVQIFFVYYALPGLIGVNMPAFFAGFLSLSLNSGAFVTEIFRGGLSSLPQGQWEAADALGLSRMTTWRRVILPQLFTRILPPLTNEFTMLVKASPLLSVITVVELTRSAQLVLQQTYLPVDAYFVAAILYFVVLAALSHLTRRMESRSERARA